MTLGIVAYSCTSLHSYLNWVISCFPLGFEATEPFFSSNKRHHLLYGTQNSHWKLLSNFAYHYTFFCCIGSVVLDLRCQVVDVIENFFGATYDLHFTKLEHDSGIVSEIGIFTFEPSHMKRPVWCTQGISKKYLTFIWVYRLLRKFHGKFPLGILTLDLPLFPSPASSQVCNQTWLNIIATLNSITVVNMRIIEQ